MIRLRDYQRQGLSDLYAQFDAGANRAIFCFPTGSGKTVTAAALILDAMAKNQSIFFIVHRQELLHQASRTLHSFGLDHGMVAPRLPRTNHQIQVMMAQTLARRLGQFEPPDFLVIDEAHHSLADTWRKIFAAYPHARAVGLTATPERMDGQGLAELYDSMVVGPSMLSLIEQCHLSDFEVYAPPIGISTEGIHTRAGDFAREELANAVDKPTITGDAVATYKRLAAGKQAIVYCVSIQHSKHVCAAFQSHGIKAVHLDGTEQRDRREQVVADFAGGKIQVLCNVDLVSEGFDVPGVEAVIMLRPTQSLVLYLQQAGRALRPGFGKVALILDHASNAMRHGLPDEQREWSLDSQKRKKSAAATNAKPMPWRCPGCDRVLSATITVCPNCGHVSERNGRAVEQKDGELEKVDRHILAKVRNQKKAGMSRFEYAIHRGVSELSVDHALKSGKIQPEPDGSIDPSKADSLWPRESEKIGMTVAEYATHRGVVSKSVYKALRTGRIQREPDGSIDPVKSDADWMRNTDPTKQHPINPITRIGLTVEAYARHRGVSEAKIRTELKAGHIQKESDGSIDPIKADAAWERNRKTGLSPSEYAIHRHASYNSVCKALKSGLIQRETDGTINPNKADHTWPRGQNLILLAQGG